MTRKTPLKGGGPLKRTGALARSTALTRTQQARKQQRTPRTPQEVRARQLVAQRSNSVCEVCGNTPASNFHHRKNASQGGPWTASNGMALCGSGTTGCHGYITEHPEHARRSGWSVPSHADPLRTPVWLARHGWVLLNDNGTFENEEAA